ncbi:Hsp20/alpha crystallin family protein [Noviherbaspirillum massiliense]|uniref:Hsp20/alpha crystallin family protein n=1 Tax=Noviherbaspirillum massiliense TaxID=1465823 RepID=UPI0003136148|nr:Hsp20/alpha crystallin family protein [Noviherbaspirillum massiliense]
MNLVLRNRIPLAAGFRPASFDAPIERLMNNMLEEFFSPYGISSAGRSEQDGVSVPRLNVVENEQAYLVEAELPGVSKENVKVSVHEHQVSIEAEVKREEEKKEGENVVYAERTVRKFSRSFTLPTEVDDANAQAKLENGILILTLPKKAAAQAKMITVQ